MENSNVNVFEIEKSTLSGTKKYHAEWYQKNKARLRITNRAKQREYDKAHNYNREKTPEQRAVRYIKRQTRRKYPLNNVVCVFCISPAEVHHHITEPLKVDKYFPLCVPCHKKIHDTSCLNRNKLALEVA